MYCIGKCPTCGTQVAWNLQMRPHFGRYWTVCRTCHPQADFLRMQDPEAYEQLAEVRIPYDPKRNYICRDCPSPPEDFDGGEDVTFIKHEDAEHPARCPGCGETAEQQSSVNGFSQAPVMQRG